MKDMMPIAMGMVIGTATAMARWMPVRGLVMLMEMGCWTPMTAMPEKDPAMQLVAVPRGKILMAAVWKIGRIPTMMEMA
jgi:hypothetical protein